MGKGSPPAAPRGHAAASWFRRDGRTEAGRTGGAAPGARSRRTSARAGSWSPAGAGAGALSGPGTGATPPAHLHARANAPCTTSSNVCIATEEEEEGTSIPGTRALATTACSSLPAAWTKRAALSPVPAARAGPPPDVHHELRTGGCCPARSLFAKDLKRGIVEPVLAHRSNYKGNHPDPRRSSRPRWLWP